MTSVALIADSPPHPTLSLRSEATFSRWEKGLGSPSPREVGEGAAERRVRAPCAAD